MLPARLPQRAMLRQLLDSGKLTAEEAQTVGQMYEDLTAGRIGGLNTQQSLWAEQVCKRCGIAVERAKPREKKQDETKKLVAQFDAMPRPKKPPGK